MWIRDRFEAAARLNNWTEEEKGLSLILALKGPAAELIQKVPPENQNIYAKLTKALELRYGDKHLCEVYRELLKARRQRSGETLREFEANVDRLTRLAYPEESEDFRKWISLIVFIDGIRDSKLQHVLRMAWHQNSSDALVHALRFEAAKSATYINESMPSRCSQTDPIPKYRHNGRNKETTQEQQFKKYALSLIHI